ncbi:MAG: sulfite reductase [Candidatus Hinthialibacteria bacterium]
MIHIEEIKLKMDGLDSIDLIRQFKHTGFSSIEKDHFALMRWYGIYQQRPNDGYFMLRIKIGGGQLTAAKLKVISSISHDYGRDLADITTRQNIQLHWVATENLADAIERLQVAGLTTTAACGDVTRNVVGCPVAGIDAHEITDTADTLKAVERRLLGNRLYSNLPRKFKISVAGCSLDCAQPLINDIGLSAVRHREDPGRIRFVVCVGGGLSTTPKFAKSLNVLLEERELPDVCEHICGIFRDYGNRENRKRARMKFLVEEWGPDKFRDELEHRLGYSMTPWSDEYIPPQMLDDDHVGIHPQKQPGLVYVGVPVKAGRTNAQQLAAVAEASERYGQGRVRLTNHQNIILLDIPENQVDPLCKDLLQAGLEVNASQTRRLLITCTGIQFCNLAITETKRVGVELVERLEKEIPHHEGLRLHMSGCPNSCGQFQTGDIGMTGVLIPKKGTDEKTEAYNLFAGGGYGENPAFGRRLILKVPRENLADMLVKVYRKYAEQRVNGETFQAFCTRLKDDELQALAKD